MPKKRSNIPSLTVLLILAAILAPEKILGGGWRAWLAVIGSAWILVMFGTEVYRLASRRRAVTEQD